MVAYYINPNRDGNGKDSADTPGTESNPFKTITYAMKERVRSGDEIILVPGAYNKASGEVFPLTILSGVAVKANDEDNRDGSITIEGGGLHSSPSGARLGEFYVTFAIASNVEMRGIIVTNPNPDPGKIKAWRGTGVWIESPDPIVPTIINCTFKNCEMEGVFVTGRANPKILDSIFQENKGYGISLVAYATGDIRRNRFEKNQVAIRTQDGVTSIITENTIINNIRSGIIAGGSSKPILRNNRIENNGDDGVVVISQAFPNLGEQGVRGGNIFINNGHSDFQKYYDLQNASSNTLTSNGNQLNPERVKGSVNFLDYKTVTYKLQGRLLNQETNDPLAGFIVRAFVDATPAKQLQDAISDSEGKFASEYKLFLPIGGASSQTRRFRLHVLNSQGTDIIWQRENIEVAPGGEVNLGDIKIKLPTKPSEFTFTQLATALKVQFPTELTNFLRERDRPIESLDGIRRAGGIQQLEGLPDSPEARTAVQTLESEAYLTLLSSDLQVNAKLLEKGYANMAAIASRPRSAFVADMAGELSAGQPDLLYQQAKAQMGSLTNILADLRIQVVNYGAQTAITDRIGSLFSPKCNCPDSESAVSPIAYLADLLNYTLLHVRNKTNPNQASIDLDGLEKQLHQPFSQYPTSSEQVDRKIRQVRICIEVLRNYLNNKSPTVNPDADNIYLFEAYRALLNQIGTSYDAIRVAKASKPTERQALAVRLGISLRQHRPDQLDELFLSLEDITEQKLEQLFGLVDTSRNPLCDGVQVGAIDRRIRRWNFNGLEWNRNTDAEGNIYGVLSLTDLPPQGYVYKLYLYRSPYINPAESDKHLVASSGCGTLEKTFILSQQYNSGLSAQFSFDSEQESINKQFIISAIPSLLCWRLQHLRDLWREQDWPADAYGTEPTTTFPEGHLLPAIDPDLIGPDDFREPFAKGPEHDPKVPFDFWLKRRDWIDGQLKELRECRKAGELIAVLKRMLDPIDYSYLDREGNFQKYTQAPWLSSYDKDIKDLCLKLERGQDLEATKKSIQTDLKLTVDSFKRLVQIKSQYDTQVKEPSEEEWEELFSILVQAQKVCLFSTWRDEEQGFTQLLPHENGHSPVLFGPKCYWMALRQPQEGSWPPPILSIRRPLIDPQEISREALLQLNAGKAYVVLWQARQVSLTEMYSALKVEREKKDKDAPPGTNGFDAILKLSVRDPLPCDLAVLKKQLQDKDKKTAEEAKEEIRTKLQMTVTGFVRLMEIKAKYDKPETPTEAEWAEVYTILTSAQKKISEYPIWIESEKEIPWLDPDFLKLTDLPEPTVGKKVDKNAIDLAIDLWQPRRKDIDQKPAKLQETENFEGMLGEALDILPLDSDENTWSTYLDNRKKELDSGDDAKVSKAKGAIANILCMTVEDFTRLMEIKAKSETVTPHNKPTQQEWAEVYTMLTQSYKFKQCYPKWVEEEQLLKYWQKLKAKLPRWRATPEARALWQRALRLRSLASIIDSDIISNDDLKHKVESDPAYNILQDRKDWIKKQKKNLKQERESFKDDPKAGLEAILHSTIGVPASDLLALADEQKKGESIAARLDQLSLEMGVFLSLMRIYALLAAPLLGGGQAILPSEWEEVYTILVQVKKRRTFADWQDEEKAKGIIHSPDFFQIPDQEPTGLSQSLGIRLARQDWQDKLNARIDQEKGIWTALGQAVDACEEATLPLLRDALINASGATGNDTAIKAKWLSEQLSLDCQMGSCQKTTRISQAMITLQNFIFSLRTGQSGSSGFELIDDEYFDEEWQWIGSYEPWKAAMGVFLYPENILLPSLRRQKTPAFGQLIEQLRTNRTLTPENARQFARYYAVYFNDVSNLTVKATCIACTQITKSLRGDLLYIFALSKTSNKVYWLVYDTVEGEAGYSQKFWQPLPNLENTLDIIGAVPYRAAGRNFIYLFAETQKDVTRELVFLRYNLDIPEKGERWEEKPISLKLQLPENATDFTAVLKQGDRHEIPTSPEVVIRLPNGAIYTRYLNQSGDDWEQQDWRTLVSSLQGNAFEICALIEIERGEKCLVVTNNNILQYRRFGIYDDGSWRKIGNGRYKGTFLFMNPTYTYLYVFFKENNSCSYKLLDFSNTPQISKEDLTLSGLESWLNDSFSVSLKNISVSYSISYQCVLEKESGSTFISKQANFSGSLFKLLEKTKFFPLTPCPTGYYSDYQEVEGEEFKTREINSFCDVIESSLNSNPEYDRWKLANETLKRISNKKDNPLREALLTAVKNSSTTLITINTRGNEVLSLTAIPLETLSYLAPNWLDPAFISHDFKIVVCGVLDENQRKYIYQCKFQPSNTKELISIERILIAPVALGSITISDQFSSEELKKRKTEIQQALEVNKTAAQSSQFPVYYVEEAYYFAPVAIALQLQRAGQYTAALDWFRTVYDYSRPLDQRKIYYVLKLEESYESGYERGNLENWLRDPLDVHRIASTRRNTYTRFTLFSIIRCFLAYADAEFTRDTIESLANARTLYETALELLDKSPELKQYLSPCTFFIEPLHFEITAWYWKDIWENLLEGVLQINNRLLLKNTADSLSDMIKGAGGWTEDQWRFNIVPAREAVHAALAEQQPASMASLFEEKQQTYIEIPKALLIDPVIERSITQSALAVQTVAHTVVASGGLAVASPPPAPPTAFAGELPAAVTFNFCIPINPILQGLRFHTENNLHKLRTCRNIAGVKREVELYAAPTDVLSALPSIGVGGQLVLPTRITPPPVPYRYEFLIERAKQLANLSAQMEAQFLSALEKRDTELYNLLKARQDVRLARAGVRLQDLRLRQSEDEVGLAELQKESAEIQSKTYQEWIAQGLNQWELQMIDAYQDAEKWKIGATHAGATGRAAQALASGKEALGWTMASIAATAYGVEALFTTLAIKSETEAQIASIYANYERRAQEWQLQLELAQQSIRIGDQQIKIANDGVAIVEQEKAIAQINVENAESVLEFLNTKFTNFELYDWMSGILEGIYCYFLQQATAMAKLAQAQLAFERQQLPPAYIQSDYWEVPSEDQLGGASEESTDRHGMTGSARLLADIYKLDQYRLETEKRKLQLTKILSLARMAPFEFQQFKETGVLLFGTPMELFDRDFPGHYLRLIKRVRTSVIALIPPTEGIKATLSSIGISRVVVNNDDLFQPRFANRSPESVALTSPTNATGLFELETQSEMLLPFEGLGVDTTWEFRLPKAANRFDYSTIADILIAIDYTALASYDYHQQAIQSLPSRLSGDRPFSFKNQFADQWYDLHNPERTDTPMTVSFRTGREDFPANIEDLKIQQVLLYFARSSGETFEANANLTFQPDGEAVGLGGETETVEGIISTRRGNAGSWMLMVGQSPFGEWTLSLPNTDLMKQRFRDERIEDILFVITHAGRTPEWPM